MLLSRKTTRQHVGNGADLTGPWASKGEGSRWGAGQCWCNATRPINSSATRLPRTLAAAQEAASRLRESELRFSAQLENNSFSASFCLRCDASGFTLLIPNFQRKYNALLLLPTRSSKSWLLPHNSICTRFQRRWLPGPPSQGRNTNVARGVPRDPRAHRCRSPSQLQNDITAVH